MRKKGKWRYLSSTNAKLNTWLFRKSLIYTFSPTISKALDNIYSLLVKQHIKSCNAKRRSQRERWTNSNRSNYQENNFERAAHFFVHFFAVVLYDYNVKLSETSWLHVFWGKVVLVFVHFFFHVAHCTLVDPSISHFLTAATKFHVVPPTKNVSFVFSLSLQLFFSLSFAGLSPYFLFFSVFLFTFYVPNFRAWQLI